MHVDRLLLLADFLETVPPERFDMARWTGVDWAGKSDLSCGTAACAMGWATTIPQFRKLGLKLNKFGVPEFKSYFGYGAATRLFDIDFYETTYLFASYTNFRHSSRNVARKIRDFIDNGMPGREA